MYRILSQCSFFEETASLDGFLSRLNSMPIHCFVRGFCFSCLESEIIQVSLYHFPTSLGLKYQHTSPLYQLLSCSPPLIIKPPVEIISANRQGIKILEAKGTCVLQENASYFQNHPGFQFLGIGNFKLS